MNTLKIATETSVVRHRSNQDIKNSETNKKIRNMQEEDPLLVPNDPPAFFSSSFRQNSHTSMFLAEDEAEAVPNLCKKLPSPTRPRAGDIVAAGGDSDGSFALTSFLSSFCFDLLVGASETPWKKIERKSPGRGLSVEVRRGGYKWTN